MANFKKLPDAQIAEKRYVKKRFIYVESEEDVQILAERWFYDKSGKVEFIPVGGCTQVTKQVKNDRDSEIEAYGIVDRDSVKREGNWLVFFESNDNQFHQAKPFGDYIHVLRYWEIENYLLHPEVIETFIADEERRSTRTLDHILRELFELACKLILVDAATILLNANGKSSLDKNFGMGQQLLDIDNGISKHVDKTLPEAADELAQYIDKVAAFAGHTEPHSLRQWLNVLRMLDGKRLIHWIKKRYAIEHDPCGHLARLTKDKLHEILDPEVYELVQ